MNNQEEIWKPVVGYEGYYEVSNLGRVKSVERFVLCKGFPRHVSEKIKNSTIAANGYPCVTLCKNRKSVQIPIHRILMEAFVPNPENKPAIDHINTIKTDNRLSNLRWVTFKENSNNTITLQHFSNDANLETQKQKRLATRKINKGVTAPITVFQYTKEGTFISEYPSAFEAERSTNVHNTSIRRVLNDMSKSAGGFLWFSSKQECVQYKRNLPKNTRIILQYSTEGLLLNKWESLTSVSKTLCLNKNSIVKSIKTGAPYKDFIFRYED